MFKRNLLSHRLAITSGHSSAPGHCSTSIVCHHHSIPWNDVFARSHLNGVCWGGLRVELTPRAGVDVGWLAPSGRKDDPLAVAGGGETRVEVPGPTPSGRTDDLPAGGWGAGAGVELEQAVPAADW